MTDSRDNHSGRKWAKFGICKEIGPTGESSVTTIAKDDIFIEWVCHDNDEENGEEGEATVVKTVDFKELAKRQVKAQLKSERLHQRLEQRKKGLRPTDTLTAPMYMAPKTIRDLSRKSQAESPTTSSRQERYVPPARRFGYISESNVGHTLPERERNTDEVRISNLSINATEADVEELCSTFGTVKRVRIKRNQRTGENQGIAFVSFDRHVYAEKCVRLLNGHGYDHLILSVDWSSNRR